MLVKIRSARLCFLGKLIYFSCTTTSLTPVFQALGHHKLRVLALGLAWPRSDLPSLGPHWVAPCWQGGCRLCGMGAERSFWEQQCRSPGAALAGDMGQRPPGWADPLPHTQEGPCPPKSHHKCPSTPPGGARGKSCFFFQNNPRRVQCQGEGCEEPGRFIAEEILSPARADGRSRNNGRFAT